MNTSSFEPAEFPFPALATSIMLVIALFGFIANIYLFCKFFQKRANLSAFQRLCLVKTIPNIIVCAAFLFWAVPLSLIPQVEVPRLPNVIIGRTAGGGAYLLGPLTQTCMAVNRFFVIYFPLGKMNSGKKSITNVVSSFSIIFSIFWTFLGFPEECGYLYDPATFTWNPEPYPCAYIQLDVFMVIIYTLAIISNSLNVMTASKLICRKSVGLVNESAAAKRRKQRAMMFVQSAIQDCLHVIDLINATYIFTLSDGLWFQFIFLTLSFVLIYALDGFVMIYFHPDLYPSCLRTKQSAPSSNQPIFTRVSIDQGAPVL